MGYRIGIPALLGMLLAASGPADAAPPPRDPPPAVEEKQVYPMPEFRVQDLDGSWLDSEKLRGQVVLIDLWGTWCAPCLAAAPALDRLYADFYERGLVMFGIAVDSGTAEEVAKAVEDLGTSYPIVLWNDHLAERIQGLSSVPTYILVDKDWTIHKLFVGATSPRILRKELEKLLPKPKGKPSR